MVWGRDLFLFSPYGCTAVPTVPALIILCLLPHTFIINQVSSLCESVSSLCSFPWVYLFIPTLLSSFCYLLINLNICQIKTSDFVPLNNSWPFAISLKFQIQFFKFLETNKENLKTCWGLDCICTDSTYINMERIDTFMIYSPQTSF